MSIETNALAELRDKAAELTNRHRGKSVEAVIRASADEFDGKICLVSSFGTESAVLLHIVSRIDAGMAIVFLDTAKHFPETLLYRDSLVERFGLSNLAIVGANDAALMADDPDGTLHGRSPDLCCHIRKTLPMLRALNPFRCWITGRKRFQSTGRNDLELFEAQDRWIKLNPLFDWDADRIDRYRIEHELPAHPLQRQGYLSVGCAPCTRAVMPGEDARAGRWPEQDKTECGIHFENGAVARRDGQANG